MSYFIGNTIIGKKIPHFNDRGIIIDIKNYRRSQELLVQWTAGDSCWIQKSKMWLSSTNHENNLENQC